jgi:hypothetical protein
MSNSNYIFVREALELIAQDDLVSEAAMLNKAVQKISDYGDMREQEHRMQSEFYRTIRNSSRSLVALCTAPIVITAINALIFAFLYDSNPNIKYQDIMPFMHTALVKSLIPGIIGSGIASGFVWCHTSSKINDLRGNADSDKKNISSEARRLVSRKSDVHSYLQAKYSDYDYWERGLFYKKIGRTDAKNMRDIILLTDLPFKAILAVFGTDVNELSRMANISRERYQQLISSNGMVTTYISDNYDIQLNGIAKKALYTIKYPKPTEKQQPRFKTRPPIHQLVKEDLFHSNSDNVNLGSEDSNYSSGEIPNLSAIFDDFKKRH